MPGIFRIILQSANYYRKQVLYQFFIIVLLCAVITGSLLTGRSVKDSLRKSASEHLGNTGILISSGIRYFDTDLIQRLKDSTDLKCCGILEMKGYCQNLNSQKGAFNVSIFGITGDFFVFQEFDSIGIKQGEVAINQKLADYLGIKPGEDLTIKFKGISDIPSDAPFAPSQDEGKSVVMKVGSIIASNTYGNFSLSISQITPMNIFINLRDIEDIGGSHLKINRLLVNKADIQSIGRISESLKHCLKPSDIGLRIRKSKNKGETELTSDRIFIDESILKEISSNIPSSAPLLTYLGNRFNAGTRSTPYSFISALPSSLYPDISSSDGMIINRWMALDLSVNKGDTIKMFWFSPDSLNNLIEKNRDFIVRDIVDMKGIWADSLLMPDFPGIAGKESCSDWDAGVPIKMHEIRTKDEDYWNRYRGTPKAFISYEKGKELWGNNFGPATAIRFSAGLTEKDIERSLAGSLNPDKIGFSLADLSAESVKAAEQSVDFGTLFLSLGFFLIVASLVLLSYATSSYFESKKGQVKTLFALGFKNKWILKVLFFEAGLISFAGCSIGALSGYFINILITKALNSVWYGAVQTDTLNAYFNIWPLISGLTLTFLTIMVFMLLKVRLFLKGMNRSKTDIYRAPSSKKNSFLLFFSAFAAIALFSLSLLSEQNKLLYSFSSGSVLLLTLILSWRQYYISRKITSTGSLKSVSQLSRLYYSANLSNAVTPVLFIAAGIFTVFITGANRMNISEKQMTRAGGTGGYLLWCENTIPVKEDLNSKTGRKIMGLDDDQLSAMHFVQIKRAAGNDASCLNLNHITVPPLLGINPEDFIAKKSFSFSRVLSSGSIDNPWQYLNLAPENNSIYGIADQTVLEWGLKLKTGDTLVVRAENGQRLNIIIAAGLKSSVFQGNVLIGKENFSKYYPSVSGSLVFLVDGNKALIDIYKNALNERLGSYGINIENTGNRLVSFSKVTNTYLSVFGIFGALGMIIGVAGLGFVLIRNYNQRKYEFALLLSTGFNVKKIRSMILAEQLYILFAGIISGIISSIVATYPSINNSPDIPWIYLILMIVAIILTGLSAMFFSVRSVTRNSLIDSLKKE